MAIIAAEIKEYKAVTNVDGASNGGRMSSNELTSGVRNNLFPNVTEAERTSGVTRWRKMFAKVANDDDLTLMNTYVHLTHTTAADDYVSIVEGTASNIYSDLSSPREYGVGVLASNITASDTSCTVTIENTALSVFNTASADNIIWVGDGTNNEYFTSVTAGKSGTTITLTLNAGDSFANSYTAATPTYVASCIDVGDIECAVSSWTETSTSGTYNESTYPLEMDNIGTVYDTWTLTFSSATNFSVSGTNTGSVGSGNISGSFAPNNADFTKPYFTINASGWGGTWASGETITFTTSPASQGIWIKKVVPAASSSYSGNSFTIRTIGESA